MNFFWGNVFEYFTERRRGGLFFGTIAAIMLVTFLCFVLRPLLETDAWQNYWPLIAGGVGLMVAAFVWHAVRKHRRWRRGARYQSTPLSSDEWVKARRKLGARPLGPQR